MPKKNTPVTGTGGDDVLELLEAGQANGGDGSDTISG